MTRLEIINSALQKCGLPLAAALTDVTWNANEYFENNVRQVLKAHAWGFATKHDTFTANAVAPTHGFTFSYDLPTDCLRVIDIRPANDLRAPAARFTVVGKQLFANVTPCNARYIYDCIDPDLWPDTFADVVATKLASEIAPLNSQSFGLGASLKQMYAAVLQSAVAADAMEERTILPIEPMFLRVR